MGVIRSAVYIAVDQLLEQVKQENVNVFRFCAQMRKRRPIMMRTLKQYVFIYGALLEALITNHNIAGDDLKVNYRLLSNINPTSDKSGSSTTCWRRTRPSWDRKRVKRGRRSRIVGRIASRWCCLPTGTGPR